MVETAEGKIGNVLVWEIFIFQEGASKWQYLVLTAVLKINDLQ